MTPEESDRHKAMKDFLDRTCESAGLERMVEKATKNRSSRPDVTIIGHGGLSLGCEAQFYNASPSAVLRRSRAHSDGGLVPAWITNNDTFHLVDRAPWMLIRDVTWREISNAADLPLVGGYRVLANWHCTAAAERPCPTGKSKTGCGKRHLHWDTPRRLDSEGTGWTGYRGNRLGVTVGRTLIGSATGSVVPLYVPGRKDRRAGSYMWVPTEDHDTWADYRDVQPPTEEPEPEKDDAIHFSGREADATCQFGDETWRPSAPLPRRGIGSVELHITVDEPTPPAIPRRRDGTGAVPDTVTPSIPIQPSPPTTPQPVATSAPSTTAGPGVPRRWGPDERAAAAALGCPPWELGGCNGCGQLMRRHGHNAPVACASCRSSASTGSLRTPRTS
ncbi:hypothetical protein [Streptomyces sp. NPDC058280]|uniref:competence protein CoiA family protein n=1 Tax=Streptomyces sp. NPDC058280 TaxID=3346419 RepID=UPI0036EC6352